MLNTLTTRPIWLDLIIFCGAAFVLVVSVNYIFPILESLLSRALEPHYEVTLERVFDENNQPAVSERKDDGTLQLLNNEATKKTPQAQSGNSEDRRPDKTEYAEVIRDELRKHAEESFWSNIFQGFVFTIIGAGIGEYLAFARRRRARPARKQKRASR